VDIYTDGACSGNPGPGGWGVVLRYGKHVKEICGGVSQPTTNNRMELTGAIEALERLTRPSSVRLHTDSTYVRDGITKWLHGWRRNGWQTAERKPVKNVDLWQRLAAAVERHHIEWIWVRGHAGHPDNERADALANRGMREATGQVASPSAPRQVPPPSMTNVRCRHDLLRDECWECRPRDPGLPASVAIAPGGAFSTWSTTARHYRTAGAMCHGAAAPPAISRGYPWQTHSEPVAEAAKCAVSTSISDSRVEAYDSA
jgi:ribonuclease HI